MGKFQLGTNVVCPLVFTRIVNNQNLTVTTNGIYTADTGYSGLGTVTVSVPSSVFNTETLIADPTTSTQVFTPTTDGYNRVTINAVTNSIDANITASNIKSGVTILNVLGTFGGVDPTGTLNISENGNYNVTTYANAVVNVQPTLGTKTITSNGIYTAGQDSLDGYSSVTVSVPSGGGSGHTLTIETTGSAQILIKVLSGGTEFYSTRGCPGGGYTNLSVHKNIESFSVDCNSSDWQYGYCSGILTMNGVDTTVNLNTTYTLTADATLKLYDQYCLTGDTIVLMADKSEKRIDQIKVGDQVLSINPETLQFEPDEIIYSDADQKKFGNEYTIWTFEKNYYVKTVNRHRFYNIERQAMVYMDEWKLGEHTFTKNKESIALINSATLKSNIQHYKITTKKWHNYFANGMLTGSRLTPVLLLKGIVK